jgi:mannose-1-phosphate guanylyltransferase
MRYALIMAGGSGTRLWPMSRGDRPKQLIPFLDGKSLLQVAFERLEGLIDQKRRCVCAGLRHEKVILEEMPELDKSDAIR